MKSSRNLSRVIFLAFIFVSAATLTSRAQILADVRADYIANSTLPLADTFGTGSWTYNQVSSSDITVQEQTLVWAQPDQSEAGPYYGGSDPIFNLGLPAVSNSTIFNGDAATASNQVALHPGASTDVEVRWTAGAGETGPITISGVLSRVGEPAASNSDGSGSQVDFAILQDGNSLLADGALGQGSVTPFSFSIDVTPGTTIDFILGSTNGVVQDNESLLSAQITEAPEPAIWAMMSAGVGFLLLIARRCVLRS